MRALKRTLGLAMVVALGSLWSCGSDDSESGVGGSSGSSTGGKSGSGSGGKSGSGTGGASGSSTGGKSGSGSGGASGSGSAGEASGGSAGNGGAAGDDASSTGGAAGQSTGGAAGQATGGAAGAGTGGSAGAGTGGSAGATCDNDGDGEDSERPACGGADCNDNNADVNTAAGFETQPIRGGSGTLGQWDYNCSDAIEQRDIDHCVLTLGLMTACTGVGRGCMGDSYAVGTPGRSGLPVCGCGESVLVSRCRPTSIACTRSSAVEEIGCR